MKRYKPSLTNTQNPWTNLGVEMLEASMVECEGGEYIKCTPMHEAAPKMYAMLNELKLSMYGSGMRVAGRRIEKLLAEARGEI